LKPIPIFDTNVFSAVERGLISGGEWRMLLRHRPGRGWPLSSVTALELLAGIERVPFDNTKHMLNLAFSASRGRILEDPRPLICTEILHIPLHPDFVLFSRTIHRYLNVARHATSVEEIARAEVRYKHTLTSGKGRAGFDPQVITDLVAGPKTQWRKAVEQIATENFPEWKKHLDITGKRLPSSVRKEVQPLDAWKVQRDNFAKTFLEWVGASTDPHSVAEIVKRLDAVIEFTIFVAREFLIGDYNLEKHDSDVYDQFQLHHLALDRFVIVTADADLHKRTQRSQQAARILTFQEFLQTL
jgi:hypothetical protein